MLALDFDLAATVRLLEFERRAVAEGGGSTEESSPHSDDTGEIRW